MDVDQRLIRMGLLEDCDRRRVVEHLQSRDPRPVSLDELAEKVYKPPPDGERPRDKETVVIQLHHVHLPKLASQGIVTYDAEARTARYEPDERTAASLEALLELAPADD
ncbi:DUF7344 domain-containing protein [Halostella litorea]|uniref:DUF7344 domain-containing protein n=1 Tax=Halostella litorea TaxID=2528831 RepID=UPI0010931ACF|nr:hypothetical protein [Halostella litorea]